MIHTELDGDSRKDKRPAFRVFGTEYQHLSEYPRIKSNFSGNYHVAYQPRARYISRIVFLLNKNKNQYFL